MKCTRCGRLLKRQPVSGMGPKCAAAVLGAKPKRQPRPKARDTATPDLFARELDVATRVQELIGGVSLEMTP